jgi:hypothetical protein
VILGSPGFRDSIPTTSTSWLIPLRDPKKFFRYFFRLLKSDTVGYLHHDYKKAHDFPLPRWHGGGGSGQRDSLVWHPVLVGVEDEC